MLGASNSEAKAIARLIAQIDSLDKLRDQVGRRVIALFFAVFCFAVGLLFYVATHSYERVEPRGLGQPVPGVMRQIR